MESLRSSPKIGMTEGTGIIAHLIMRVKSWSIVTSVESLVRLLAYRAVQLPIAEKSCENVPKIAGKLVRGE